MSSYEDVDVHEIFHLLDIEMLNTSRPEHTMVNELFALVNNLNRRVIELERERTK